MSAIRSLVRCTHGYGFNCRECWPDVRAPTIREAKVGDMVISVCGPCESHEPQYAREVGTVYGLIRDRWGEHLRVKWRSKLDGSVRFDTTHTFTLVGIGCYLWRDGLPVVKFQPRKGKR